MNGTVTTEKEKRLAEIGKARDAAQSERDVAREKFGNDSNEAKIADEKVESIIAMKKETEEKTGSFEKMGPFVLISGELIATKDGCSIGNGAWLERVHWRGDIQIQDGARVSDTVMSPVRVDRDERVMFVRRAEREGSLRVGKNSEVYFCASNDISVTENKMLAYQGMRSGHFSRTGIARSPDQKNGIVIKQYGFLFERIKYAVMDVLALIMANAREVKDQAALARQSVTSRQFWAKDRSVISNLGVAENRRNLATAIRTFIAETTAGTGLRQVFFATIGAGTVALAVAFPATLPFVGTALIFVFWQPMELLQNLRHPGKMFFKGPSSSLWVAGGAVSSILLGGSFLYFGIAAGVIWICYLGARILGQGAVETGIFASAWKRESEFRKGIREEIQSVLRDTTSGAARWQDIAGARAALLGNPNITSEVISLLEKPAPYEQDEIEADAVRQIKKLVDERQELILKLQGAKQIVEKIKIRQMIEALESRLATDLADAILANHGASRIEKSNRDRKGLIQVIKKNLHYGQLSIEAGTTAEIAYNPAVSGGFPEASRRLEESEAERKQRIAANERWLETHHAPNFMNIKVVFTTEGAKDVGRYWDFVGVKGRSSWEDREGAQAIISTNFNKGDIKTESPFAVAGFTAITERWDLGSSIHELSHFNSPVRKHLRDQNLDTDLPHVIGLEEVYNFFLQYITSSYEYGFGFYNVERILNEKMSQYANRFGNDERGLRLARLAFTSVLHMEQIGLTRPEIMGVLGKITTVQDLIQFHFFGPEDIALIKQNVGVFVDSSREQTEKDFARAQEAVEQARQIVKIKLSLATQAEADLKRARTAFKEAWSGVAGKSQPGKEFVAAQERVNVAQKRRDDANSELKTARNELEKAEKQVKQLAIVLKKADAMVAQLEKNPYVPKSDDVMMNLDSSQGVLNLDWPRIRKQMDDLLADEATGFKSFMDILRDATAKEQLWMLYELKKRADSENEQASRAREFLSRFYEEPDASEILVSVVKISREVLFGQRHQQSLSRRLLDPVLTAAPETIRTQVSLFTGWLPAINPVLENLAGTHLAIGESHYRQKTKELVDSHNWKELEGIVRGLRGSDETRAMTVSYLYRDHRYNPEVEKILSYFNTEPPVTGFGKNFSKYWKLFWSGPSPVVLGVSIAISGIMLLLGVGTVVVLTGFSLYLPVHIAMLVIPTMLRTRNFEKFVENTSRAIYALKGAEQPENAMEILQSLIRGIRAFAKGENGVALKGEKLRSELWDRVHYDRTALNVLAAMEKYEGTGVSLTPSLPELQDKTVSSDDARTSVEDILAIKAMSSAENRNVWGAIEDELVFSDILTKEWAEALKNYKTWMQTGSVKERAIAEEAYHQLLMEAFDAYLRKALPAEEADAALAQFKDVFPDRDGRSLTDKAIQAGQDTTELAKRNPGVRKYLSEKHSKPYLLKQKELVLSKAQEVSTQEAVTEFFEKIENELVDGLSDWQNVRQIMSPVLSEAAQKDLDALEAAGNRKDYESTLMLALREILENKLGIAAAHEKLMGLRNSIARAQHAKADKILKRLNAWSEAKKREAAQWILNNLDDTLDHLISKYGLDEETLMHARFEPNKTGVGGKIVLDPDYLPEDFLIRDKNSGASEPFGRPQQYLRYTFVTEGYTEETAIHEEGHDLDNLYSFDYDGRIYGIWEREDFIQKKKGLLIAEIHSFLREIYVSKKWKEASGIKDLEARKAEKKFLVDRHIAKVKEEYLPLYLKKILKNLKDPLYPQFTMQFLDAIQLPSEIEKLQKEILEKSADMILKSKNENEFSNKYLATFRAPELRSELRGSVEMEKGPSFVEESESLTGLRNMALEVNGILGGPVRPETIRDISIRTASPVSDPNLKGNIGYQRTTKEGKTEVVLSDVLLERPDDTKLLHYAVSVLIHEVAHAEGKDELAAYEITADALEALDAGGFELTISRMRALLRMARGEMSSEVMNRKLLKDIAIQILEGGRNVHDGIETILSRLNPKVIHLGDDIPEAFEGMGLTAVAGLGALEAELKRSSANHTTILMSEEFLGSLTGKPQDARKLAELLKAYPILRYGEHDRRDSTVVLVAELMASSLEILREHYRLPERDEIVNGIRFRFYDAGDLKKTLADFLTEYQARAAVARAA
ncbi:MAG TPA: hypothetical protein PK590_03870 [Candidatus Omnitrophota bacterium]|nr:hypothetical protein [Candidatus Omnitrophota bacterium]